MHPPSLYLLLLPLLQLKKVDIKLKDIEIGRLVNDTTVVIKPLPMFNLSSLMAKLHKDDLMALGKNDSKTEVREQQGWPLVGRL